MDHFDESGFMTVDHPQAFLGMEKKIQPIEHHADWTHECPACKGYGGHHLTIDAYGPGRHFEASCFQCRSWGWVGELDAECTHAFLKELSFWECRERGIYHAGNCYHVYVCDKCGRVQSCDSSD